jgi:hypothetical protein
MDSRKRKPEKDAVHPYNPRHEKDELDAQLEELALHVALRIAEAKRLNLPKVRFEMIDIGLAQTLFELLQAAREGKRIINAERR